MTNVPNGHGKNIIDLDSLLILLYPEANITGIKALGVYGSTITASVSELTGLLEETKYITFLQTNTLFAKVKVCLWKT